VALRVAKDGTAQRVFLVLDEYGSPVGIAVRADRLPVGVGVIEGFQDGHGVNGIEIAAAEDLRIDREGALYRKPIGRACGSR